MQARLIQECFSEVQERGVPFFIIGTFNGMKITVSMNIDGYMVCLGMYARDKAYCNNVAQGDYAVFFKGAG